MKKTFFKLFTYCRGRGIALFALAPARGDASKKAHLLTARLAFWWYLQANQPEPTRDHQETALLK